MEKIRLSKYRKRNHSECMRLHVFSEQSKFIHSNSYSLHEAKNSSDKSLLWMIRRGETAVGFIMLRYLTPNKAVQHAYPHMTCYEIARIMVDAKHQGKGYGKAALQQILHCIDTQPLGPASLVCLSFHPQNTVARHLYHSAGFQETDTYNTLGERIAFLSLR